MRGVMPDDMSNNANRQLAVRLIVFALAGFVIIVSPHLVSTATDGARFEVAPQGRLPRRVSRNTQKTAAQTPRIDYSHFSHRTHVEKQKLNCDSCHKFPTKNWKEVRKGDAA